MNETLEKSDGETFFQRHKVQLCFCALFAVAACVNAPFLTYPLFWDEMTGLHNQALFLKNNHFSILQLFADGQTFGEGGSGIYHFSFIPYLYGILYSLLPSAMVIVAARLISLASASACAFLMYRLCEKEKIPPKVAILCTGAFFCVPYFYGQALAAGQDMILAFATMLSLYYFYNGRDKASALCLFIACTIKITGAALGGAVCVYLAAQGVAIFVKSKKISTEILLKILLYAASVIFSVIPYALVNTHIKSSIASDFARTASEIVKHFNLFFFWQALFVFIVICMAAFAFAKKRTCFHGFNPRLSVFILFTAAFFCGYFLQDSMARCPRYAVITVMPTAFACACLMRGMSIRTNMTAFCLFLIVNIVNFNGMLLPAIPQKHQADGAYYERSLEYRKKILADMRLVAYLENNMRETQLVAAWPFPQMLTVPEFGYVSKPFEKIYTGKIFPKYTGARRLSEIDFSKRVLCLVDTPVFPSFLAFPDYRTFEYIFVSGDPADGACAAIVAYPRLAEDIAEAAEKENQ